MELIFDAHPEVIFAKDRNGRDLIDTARSGSPGIVAFLQTQLSYAMKVEDELAMTTPNENGKLLLHHALGSNASLGTIKLLMKGTPSALQVQVADNEGMIPLHIACQFGTVDIVQPLVGLNVGCLVVCGAKKDVPLHYACRGGNCDTVMYLLETQAMTVSKRNAVEKLPIHPLCEADEAVVDRGSIELKYTEAIWRHLASPSGLSRNCSALNR